MLGTTHQPSPDIFKNILKFVFHGGLLAAIAHILSGARQLQALI